MSTSLRTRGLCIVFVFALAACGSSGAATPSVTAGTAVATPVVTPSSAPSSRPKVSQSDTDWGRIWDGLPPGFPSIPGATPDENAAGGPASAVFVVQNADAKMITTSLQTALASAGYTTVGSMDPLEDGSIVLEMTGKPAGCAVQATATPTGGLTTVRILYGALCPYS
jgi:hypothetical protein